MILGIEPRNLSAKNLAKRDGFSDFLHELTEPYGPDGKYGKLVTYSLVVLPLSWLCLSSLLARKPSPSKQTAIGKGI